MKALLQDESRNTHEIAGTPDQIFRHLVRKWNAGLDWDYVGTFYADIGYWPVILAGDPINEAVEHYANGVLSIADWDNKYYVYDERAAERGQTSFDTLEEAIEAIRALDEPEDLDGPEEPDPELDQR